MSDTVYLGLGSNIEDKVYYINQAIIEIKKYGMILKKAKLYKTDPVDAEGIEQDWFLNTALEVDTYLSAHEFHKKMQSIEQKLGRKHIIKNGPRTLDIDILFFSDEIIKDENLVVPHPRMHQRKFVLEPLLEIAGDKIHPVFQKSIETLYNALNDSSSVVMYDK